MSTRIAARTLWRILLVFLLATVTAVALLRSAPQAQSSTSLIAGGASAAGIVISDGYSAAVATGCNTKGLIPSVNITRTGYQLVTGLAAGQVTCSGGTTTSSASVAELNLTVAGVRIHADLVSVPALSGCTLLTTPPHIIINNLQINGVAQPAALNGSLPNQTVSLPNGLGTLTVNEQTGGSSTFTVTALHVHMTSGLDFQFATATVDTTGCVPHPPTPTPGTGPTPTPGTSCCIPAGSASGIAVSDGYSAAVATACNTKGLIPSVNITRAGYLLVTGLASGQTVCATQAVTSTAFVAELNLTVAGIRIHADLAQTQAVATCGATPYGQTLINNLQINGVAQSAAFNGSLPNQTLSLPNGLGTLTTNAQTISGSSITVTAIDVHMSSGLHFTFGMSTASTSGSGAPCVHAPVVAAQVADRRLAAA